MIKTYTIADEVGLHARPASILAQVASTFEEDVNIIYSDKKITLKSIIAVMSLGIPHGAEFSIEVLGDNEVVFKELEKVMVEHNVI